MESKENVNTSTNCYIQGGNPVICRYGASASSVLQKFLLGEKKINHSRSKSGVEIVAQESNHVILQVTLGRQTPVLNPPFMISAWHSFEES